MFGAEGSNDLHWKRLFPDRLDEFRAGLHAATGKDAAEFQAYWEEMKRWRDTNFVHHEQAAQLPPKWPHFDTALAAAEFYYGWVIHQLGEREVYMLPADLGHYRQVVRVHFDEAAVLALDATRQLPPSAK